MINDENNNDIWKMPHFSLFIIFGTFMHYLVLVFVFAKLDTMLIFLVHTVVSIYKTKKITTI